MHIYASNNFKFLQNKQNQIWYFKLPCNSLQKYLHVHFREQVWYVLFLFINSFPPTPVNDWCFIFVLTITGDWFVASVNEGHLTLVTRVNHTGHIAPPLTFSCRTLVLITQHWGTAVSTHWKTAYNYDKKNNTTTLAHSSFFLALYDLI